MIGAFNGAQGPTTGGNNILIGSSTDVPNPAASGQLNIGALITGTNMGTLSTQTVDLPGTKPSISPSTGALTVGGGVGIGGALVVGGNTTLLGSSFGTNATTNSFGPAGTGVSPVTFQMQGGSGVGGGSSFQFLKNSVLRWQFGEKSAMYGSAATDFLIFSQAGINALQIAYADGAVSLASTTPSSSPFNGALTVGGGLGVTGAGNFGGNVTIISSGAGLTISDSGGTPSTTQAGFRYVDPLHLGPSLWSQAAATTNTYLQWINANGVIGSIAANTTATLYNTTSDKRLKTNERDVADPRAVIMNTKIWDFEWKASGQRSVGVFAQDAYAVCPDAISAPKSDDELWQIDYSKYVPHLLAHNQLLQRELDKLNARIASLEAKSKRK
jgi:hypothetical protein